MKVLHVNTFDSGGGAARAAIRLHEGLRECGIDSHFVTLKSDRHQDAMYTPLRGWQAAAAVANRYAAAKILSTQKTPTNRVIHSLGVFGSGLGRWIQRSDFDVVNLHWIGAEALSILEIARICKPIVWTMHDMWPFMGAEHYDDLEHPGRWMLPYSAANRPPTYRGPDLDRCVWRRKARLWREKKFSLVAPSNWLAGCARNSALMKDQPCTVIHNPINTRIFRPASKPESRSMLGLPADKNLLLFGALGAISDERKGFDLLLTTLRRLGNYPSVVRNTEVVVFGGDKNSKTHLEGFQAHFLGTLHDDISLRLVYSSADVFVATSRQDNLPNTVVEAGACGLPTAAFDVGGMSDIVVPQVTGALARPFDCAELACVIDGLIREPIASEVVRTATAARFGVQATVPLYAALYRKVTGYNRQSS